MCPLNFVMQRPSEVKITKRTQLSQIDSKKVGFSRGAILNWFERITADACMRCARFDGTPISRHRVLQNLVGGEAGLMHSFRKGDELKGNRTEDNVRVRNAAQFIFIFI